MPQGLTFTRYFTEKLNGVHPFDAIEWELRTAEILDSKGQAVFRQEGVEVPSFWSETATNIVASKYFHGQLTAKDREYSVKQLINRVVNTIANYGTPNGYFSKAQGKIFSEELAYLLVHQMVSFNSPVWFNVGLPDTKPQISACFITAVEDDMDSILDLIKIEGRIFKRGSGSGNNLSKLREANAPLSGGGSSSGPLSFMKALDASAGVIKSGGTTRRAACMRIMDVDHPDLLEFIDCKAKEEHKAHALIDAGYDSSFTGEAYSSVFFQNSNNSVRVTDEFMRAVEADEDWQLISRVNGEVKATLKARDIFRRIAQAAWECGDPGLQFDTVINDWHTSPNSGRISASNPCCLTGDTLILTTDGPIAIAKLTEASQNQQPLPQVFTLHNDKNQVVLEPIIKAWVAGETDKLLKLVLDSGLEVTCTPEHRFLSNQGDWLCAGDILPGQMLHNGSAGYSGVLHVDGLTPSAEISVYDLEVAGSHNFVICDAKNNTLLAHNSEFMYLDWSSCNLLSANLLKFYSQDTGFSAEGFIQAVDICITAMECLVGLGVFPDPKIDEVTRASRPLGLGYANLGALLMTQGLPYDSQEGRALSAVITAIMTGAAYAQSARLASVVGPFEYYSANQEAMARVISMHRDAVNYIDADKLTSAHLKEVAATVWIQAQGLGKKFGFRNSQATVLAPTGCVVADTMVTTERGLLPIERLGDPSGSRWQPLPLAIASVDGATPANKFFINGSEAVVSIKTHRGYEIKGTTQHRIKVVNTDHQIEWRHLSDIQAGDLVPMMLKGMIGEPVVVKLPPLGEEYWNHCSTATTPSQITPELAELVGYFMGDGSLHAKGLRFAVYLDDPDVALRIAELVHNLFNIDAQIVQERESSKCLTVYANSTPLTIWWEACGFSKHVIPNERSNALGTHIPLAVWETNNPDVYRHFLRGLFEADGTASKGYPSFTTISLEFSHQVQLMLLALGFPSTRKTDPPGWGSLGTHNRYQLRVLNKGYVEHFAKEIGFLSARKQAICDAVHCRQGTGRDYIPLPKSLLYALPFGDLRRVALGMFRNKGIMTRNVAQRILTETQNSEVESAMRFFYDRVEAVDLQPEHLTYDISVPKDHSYLANGFVNHNTISFMMDCTSTGVEPFVSLVSYKKMVGEGLLRMVAETVPYALTVLGYSRDAQEQIIAYIQEHDTIEGAPGLKPEHLPVFDCAFKPALGSRSIPWQAHVEVMGAIQPFISGAISKTVNLPTEATVEDIEAAYLQAWKAGCKAIAIYRDGCKRSQPVSTSRAQATGEKGPSAGIAVSAHRKLPKDRPSLTHKFEIAGHKGFLVVGLYEDGTPGEIFVVMSKTGSSLRGIMDAFAISVSTGLQYGVPLTEFISKFAHMRFDPSGMTDDPAIRIARSIPDYIVRWLANQFCTDEQREALGIHGPRGTAFASLGKVAAGHIQESSQSDNPTVLVDTGFADEEDEEEPPTTLELPAQVIPALPDFTGGDENICENCGSLTMVRTGACFTCTNCGWNGGCG